MAKFEIVPLAELKTRLPAKLLPLVEEYKEKLEKLQPNQGVKLVLENGDDAKDLRRAPKAAAGSLDRRIRFPFRGEEGAVSFYLEKPRGRRPKAETVAGDGEGARGRESRFDAAIRIHVREVQEAVRADHDHLRAGEGEADVPHVQRHEGHPAAHRLHGADIEEELMLTL